MIQTEDAAGSYIGTILLAITGYAGLLRSAVADNNDFQRLGDLIDRIPSQKERAHIWAELALRAHAGKNAELCRQVVLEHVRPLLQKLQMESPRNAEHIVATVAPALHCASLPLSAKEDLEHVTPYNRDVGYFFTCRYLFRGHTSFEPFGAVPGQKYDVDYERALDICGIVELIQRDDIAYGFIHDLVNSVSRDKLTREQVTALALKLANIAKVNFPNPAHIKHEGYAICVRALIERLKRSSGIIWDNLAAEARALPNLSDRVFVLSEIASACQSRDCAKCVRLLREAKLLAIQFPVSTSVLPAQNWCRERGPGRWIEYLRSSCLPPG